MPKHDDHTADVQDNVERIRGPIRRIADKLPTVPPIEVALGALYASHDLAMRSGMNAHDAIEWTRMAADLMERQLLERAACQ